jgi:hypothetical protein
VIGGEFCWITTEGARFGAFFIPGLLILHTNVIFFFFVAREIHETLAESKVLKRFVFSIFHLNYSILLLN